MSCKRECGAHQLLVDRRLRWMVVQQIIAAFSFVRNNWRMQSILLQISDLLDGIVFVRII